MQARVPPSVPIRARPVFPGVPPPRARQNEYGRRLSHGTVAPARVYEFPTVVTAPQHTDREVGGLKLVDARRKSLQVRTDDIHLDVVKGPGTGGATVQNLAARVCPSLGDTYRGEQAG